MLVAIIDWRCKFKQFGGLIMIFKIKFSFFQIFLIIWRIDCFFLTFYKI